MILYILSAVTFTKIFFLHFRTESTATWLVLRWHWWTWSPAKSQATWPTCTRVNINSNPLILHNKTSSETEQAASVPQVVCSQTNLGTATTPALWAAQAAPRLPWSRPSLGAPCPPPRWIIASWIVQSVSLLEIGAAIPKMLPKSSVKTRSKSTNSRQMRTSTHPDTRLNCADHLRRMVTASMGINVSLPMVLRNYVH